MSAIPSNELKDLFDQADKDQFVLNIVGSVIDDGKNTELRTISRFSKEHVSVIFEDELQPKAIRLTEDFEMTNPTKRLKGQWLKSRPLSSKRRLFMEWLGLSINWSSLSKIKQCSIEGAGSRSPYALDAEEVTKSIHAYFDHYLSKGLLKLGANETLDSYSGYLSIFFNLPTQRRLISMMDKRLDANGEFKRHKE